MIIDDSSLINKLPLPPSLRRFALYTLALVVGGLFYGRSLAKILSGVATSVSRGADGGAPTATAGTSNKKKKILVQVRKVKIAVAKQTINGFLIVGAMRVRRLLACTCVV